MPLEELGCSRCGSSDVVEYKPDRYVCRNCDTQFKWDKPSSAVEAPLALCACGNKAEYLCQMCKLAQTCSYCDIVTQYEVAQRQWHHGGRGSRSHPLLEVLPTLPNEGWGYLIRDGGGPLIPAMKGVFATHSSGDVPKHVCSTCAESTFDALRHSIIARRSCAEPYCYGQADFVCGCCALGYCLSHRGGFTPGSVVIQAGDGCSGYLPGQTRPICWPEAYDPTLCRSCQKEKRQATLNFASHSLGCELEEFADPPVLRIGNLVRFVPVKSSREQRENRRLENAKLKEIASEVSKYFWSVIWEPCRLGEDFTKKERYITWKITGANEADV